MVLRVPAECFVDGFGEFRLLARLGEHAEGSVAHGGDDGTDFGALEDGDQREVDVLADQRWEGLAPLGRMGFQVEQDASGARGIGGRQVPVH